MASNASRYSFGSQNKIFVFSQDFKCSDSEKILIYLILSLLSMFEWLIALTPKAKKV